MAVQKNITKVTGQLILDTGTTSGGKAVTKTLGLPTLSTDAEDEQIFTIGDAIAPCLRYAVSKTRCTRRYVLENN